MLEGHWAGDDARFQSDRMLVKHDATYVAKNDDRLKEADEGGHGATAGASSSTPRRRPP